MELKFVEKKFEDLSRAELYSIFALRSEIFIVEQNCPYHDIDDKDKIAKHILIYENEILVAYCRVMKSLQEENVARISRIIVKQSYRLNGIGTKVVKRAIEVIEMEFKLQTIRIEALSNLISFYQNLGFKAVSEPYIELDYEHISMLRN